MKARFLAMLMSFFVFTLPTHASTDLGSKKHSPVENNSVSHVKIDLNKADVSQLTGSFKGIGNKRAQAIIAYRESHSGFKSLEELGEVKGFGQHFIEANREKLKEVFVIN